MNTFVEIERLGSRSVSLRLILAIIIIGLSVLCLHERAHADGQSGRGARRALLIANSSYRHEARLKTPRRDVEIMRTKLRGLGYQVTVLQDLGGVELSDEVASFSRMLSPSDEVYFHYAGHGLEVDGEAMLLGVDFTGHTKSEALHRGYYVSAVVSLLSKVKRAVVVIDACRNNPFARSIVGGRGGSSRGLPSQVSVDVDLDDGNGLYLVFSTTKGSIAQDGGKLSPFVEALSSVIDEYGHEVIQDLFSGRVQPQLMQRGQSLATRTFGVLHSYTLRRPDARCPSACRPSCAHECIAMVHRAEEAEARAQRAETEAAEARTKAARQAQYTQRDRAQQAERDRAQYTERDRAQYTERDRAQQAERDRAQQAERDRAQQAERDRAQQAESARGLKDDFTQQDAIARAHAEETIRRRESSQGVNKLKVSSYVLAGLSVVSLGVSIYGLSRAGAAEETFNQSIDPNEINAARADFDRFKGQADLGLYGAIGFGVGAVSLFIIGHFSEEDKPAGLSMLPIEGGGLAQYQWRW